MVAIGTGDPHAEDALSAARQYYEQGRSMDVIARHLGTSRSTVSRLLSYARNTGLVEIRVLRPQSRVADLEESLSARYNVRAQVAHAPESSSSGERLERTASQAGQLLSSLVDSDSVLAISWGTMVNTISRYLVPRPTANGQIVLLNGIGNSMTTGIHYANTLLSEFSAAFNAHVQQLPLPLFFDSDQSRKILFADRSVRRIVELQNSADIALFNVGTVTNGVPSPPYMNGYPLQDSDFALLREDSAIGDIATTFIRADGSYDKIRFNQRTSGPDLHLLSQIPRRLCVTSGEHKVDALHAALSGGYVTDLVVDEFTADTLLERFA